MHFVAASAGGVVLFSCECSCLQQPVSVADIPTPPPHTHTHSASLPFSLPLINLVFCVSSSEILCVCVCVCCTFVQTHVCYPGPLSEVEEWLLWEMGWEIFFYHRYGNGLRCVQLD